MWAVPNAGLIPHGFVGLVGLYTLFHRTVGVARPVTRVHSKACFCVLSISKSCQTLHEPANLHNPKKPCIDLKCKPSTDEPRFSIWPTTGSPRKLRWSRSGSLPSKQLLAHVNLFSILLAFLEIPKHPVNIHLLQRGWFGGEGQGQPEPSNSKKAGSDQRQLCKQGRDLVSLANDSGYACMHSASAKVLVRNFSRPDAVVIPAATECQRQCSTREIQFASDRAQLFRFIEPRDRLELKTTLARLLQLILHIMWQEPASLNTPFSF